MKERPIIFSAPMVRAILDGSKTQTRRVVKPQPIPATTAVGTFHHPDDDDGRGPRYWSGGPDPENPGHSYIQPDWAIPCPYGQPGGRLWVREAFDFLPSGGPDEPQACEIVYWATGSHEPRTAPSGYNPMIYGHEKVRPSIHMPRWASRITLEVTGVRVERLQEISEVDAMAEGITRLTEPLPPRRWSGPNRFTLKGMGSGACAGSVSLNAPAAEDLYRRLWESINGPGSWDLNPWVWVVEFKRLPEDRK